jgi:hypothetical protein
MGYGMESCPHTRCRCRAVSKPAITASLVRTPHSLALPCTRCSRWVDISHSTEEGGASTRAAPSQSCSRRGWIGDCYDLLRERSRLWLSSYTTGSVGLAVVSKALCSCSLVIVYAHAPDSATTIPTTFCAAGSPFAASTRAGGVVREPRANCRSHVRRLNSVMELSTGSVWS